MQPCPHLADTAAAALHPDGLRAMSAQLREHLRACPECRAEFAAAQALAARLRNAPEAAPAKDLAEKIMAALPPVANERTRLQTAAIKKIFLPFSPRRMAAVAALLLVTLFVLWQAAGFATDGWRASPRAVTTRCEWLAGQQDADGLWRPQATGGNPAYRPAISALITLALGQHHELYKPEIGRAQAALLKLQQPGGAFDASTAGAYNHGIVTTALLTMRAGPENDPALRRAVAHIIAGQQPSGGWGYTGADTPNTAVTAWHIEALSRADALGWPEARAPLNRGLRWLRARATPSGHFAYHETSTADTSDTLDAIAIATLFSAGRAHPELTALASQSLARLAPARETDHYRDYFMARAYAHSGDAKRARAVAERALSTHPGRDADRWGAVGGNLCSAALALLAVN